MGLKETFESLSDNIGGVRDTAFRRLRMALRRKNTTLGIAAVALLSVFSVIITVIVVKSSQRERKTPAPPLFELEQIAEKDLFIPSEPDFLPEVLLEQHKKERWTDEDAAAFWTSPAQSADVWRGSVRTIVDGVLERVP